MEIWTGRGHPVSQSVSQSISVSVSGSVSVVAANLCSAIDFFPSQPPFLSIGAGKPTLVVGPSRRLSLESIPNHSRPSEHNSN